MRRLLPAVAALALLGPAATASAGPPTPLTPSDYALVPELTDQTPIASQGPVVPFAAVATQPGTRRMAARKVRAQYAGATGFSWSTGDNSTKTWIPQGITTDEDSDVGASPGAAARPRTVIVSWHTASDDASRISIVNWDDTRRPTYHHVRLVVPKAGASGGSKPFASHVGGIAWIGHFLYVAKTNDGVHVFDLNGIRRVGSQLVLPQVVRFHPPGAPKMQWSWLSVDPTAKALVAGSFAFDASGPVVRYPLDPDGLLTRPGGVATPADAIDPHVERVQGGVYGPAGTFLASQSRSRKGDHDADSSTSPWLVRVKAGADPVRVNMLPSAPEALSYGPSTGRIWSLTELIKKRWVFWFDSAGRF